MNFIRAAVVGNAKFLCPLLRVHPNFSRRCITQAADTETMAEIKLKMMERLGLETGYLPNPKPREHLLQYEPQLEDLPPRSMQNSFSSAIIPLSKSKSLQDKYIASLGQVRVGRLMEDMDMFAVWTCHQHLKIPKLDPTVSLPYTFVTILVDKIVFTDFIPRANLDIRISGHVTWVGRSSMEIEVWLEQLSEGQYKRITKAVFLMAARNATNTKSAPVNPLVPANEKEEVVLAAGKSRQELRKQLQQSSLLNVEPNDAEQTLMHDIFIRTFERGTMELNRRILPANARWMEDTKVVTTMASFPENRNAHNTVFGGFLMRNAVEISWVCSWLYCGVRPKLEAICDVRFQMPVRVSSFLKISSHVVYTEKNYVQVMTIADIVDPSTGQQKTSNIFSFTYKTPDMVPEVLPRSYDEALWYIEGRRKLNYALRGAI